MKNITPVLLVLFCLAAVACGPSSSPVNSGPPARIVSLLPSYTQIVIALGAGERLVGRTSFCPTEGVPATAEVVGGALDMNYETILRTAPDLVLAQESFRTSLNNLQQLHLNVLALPSQTLTDVPIAIYLISRALQIPEAGDKLIAELNDQLNKIRRENQCRESKRTLLIMGHAPGELRDLGAIGHGTFLDELLTIAGGENALPEGAALYPTLSNEGLTDCNPEVILVFDPRGEDSAAALEAERKSWHTMPFLEAVRHDRIYLITDPFALSPGPDMAKTAATIARLIHSADEPKP